ncbi:MAG: hypothetical protein GYB53_17550 [Rhodobacteraceae bacterium]|nr:hypothetical protein [Paracoccaceae bacterium]MBR9823691.1 hypothetical protein [Paracoccaceae bacterium]
MSACPSRSALAGLLLLLPLAACSTSGVAPEIAAFATATGAAAEAGQAAGSGLSVSAEDLAAARRRVLAAHEARYRGVSGSACDPSVRLDPRPLSETCLLRPEIRDAAGTWHRAATAFDPPAARLEAEVVLEPVAESDVRLWQRYESALLLDELDAYADALSTLATTAEPGEVAREVAESVTAVSELHTTVAAFAKARVRTAPEAPDYGAIGGLMQKVTAEALEARRYALLKALVELYDPAVQAASWQLGQIALLQDREALIAANDRLKAVALGRGGGTVAWLEQVEAAHGALLQRDSHSGVPVYARIGQAHAAILASFNEPASAERLVEANTRIQALIKAVDTYKASR